MTIKNIPADLYLRLKENARRNRRSINSEIVFCLERSLVAIRVEPEAFLARIGRRQKDSTLPSLTDEFLQAAKEEGRR